jgi:type I site-specific restriction endonuclease
MLYLDRKALGAVEAKADGTLTGVEAQSAKYAAGLPDNLPAHHRPLPFLFESKGRSFNGKPQASTGHGKRRGLVRGADACRLPLNERVAVRPFAYV